METELNSLQFHVLLALGEGPSHGYAIGKELEARSEGRMRPTTGTLYQALRRLEEAGFIAAAPEARSPGEDERRKYFQLTPAGRLAAAREAERLDQLVRVARSRNLYTAR